MSERGYKPRGKCNHSFHQPPAVLQCRCR
jgi:hypothetical protein